MNDPAPVGAVHRGGQIDRVGEHLLEGQRALGQARRERLALDVLHHQEVHAVLITYVVERADVRVIQRGDRPRFALESFACHRIHMKQRGQDLDSHGSGQASITALVDLPHAAGSQKSGDLIRTETRARWKWHRKVTGL